MTAPYVLSDADKDEIERLLNAGVEEEDYEICEKIAIHFYERGRLAEREACIGIITKYLVRVYDQRAVSWHEIQDCLAVIRARSTP